MEEAAKKKGTVTPISSLFSPEETHKASERVQEKITERRKQLEVLKGFISDNTDLIHLVQTLPNELQHQIMVLLGDAYYAERTSKQTVEILKRRQKVLESQVESAKADIQDLKTEAYFFDATADEAASGLVQIVEDYNEERPSHEASNSATKSISKLPSVSGAEPERAGNEDDEYERILSRLDELEKEEEAAENGDDSEQSDEDFDRSVYPFPRDEVVRPVGVNGSKQVSQFQDVTSQAGAPASNKSSLSKSALQLPEMKQNVQAPAVAKHEASVPPLPPSTSSSSKAFTGSIVEHPHNLGTKPREETIAGSSKPVSRFKMNRK